MEKTLVIPSETAQEFYHGSNDILNGVRFVDKIFYGEWRWGTEYQLVIQDVADDKFYSTIVKEQTGEAWYLSLEDEENITFDEVNRFEEVSYAYVRPA